MRNYQRKFLVLSILSFFIILGCATTKKATGLQKQALETEYIEGKYDAIFKAIRTTFLNEGYTIKQSEIASGFILFSKPYELTAQEEQQAVAGNCLAACPYTSCIGTKMQADTAKKGNTIIEVTVTIEDMREKSEIRTSFTQIPGMKTGEYGIFLKRIYADVRKQVMMKQNQ